MANTTYIMVRMSEEEKRNIQRQADMENLTQSDFIRKLLGFAYTQRMEAMADGYASTRIIHKPKPNPSREEHS